jgi:hypothetical protein
MVRIPGFHPGGPGSIPGCGTFYFPIFILYQLKIIKQKHIDPADQSKLELSSIYANNIGKIKLLKNLDFIYKF